jgi:Glycosyl transferase family 2
MPFLGLMTRCKDEPYVTEFVSYYLRQGVDRIFILDDNSRNKRELYKNVSKNPRVVILPANISTSPQQDHFLSCKRLFKIIRYRFQWIISVDMDEYIAAKKNKTIRQELQTTFRHCVCIKIPWVMMSCNNIETNPQSLLKTNLYRWNHDLRHSNPSQIHKFRCRYDSIEVKCIFRPLFFKDVATHHPIKPLLKNNNKIVDGVFNKPAQLHGLYYGLRERHIENAYLLCYHYRIVSKEHCRQKIESNAWYKRFTVENLLSNDYPEKVDETMKTKN